MKKLLSFLAIAACGVVLFASCESSEAVTRNLLEWQGYRYNIASAQQFVDPVDSDTLFVIEDGDTLCAGFTYSLILNSPGIGVDTLDPNFVGDLFYTYPTDDRKFAQLVIKLNSPGLNGLCEGTYTISDDYGSTKGHDISKDDFFTSWGAFIYDNSVGAATKAVTYDDLDALCEQLPWSTLAEGTITIKKGMAAYDIEFKGIDDYDNPVVARYTGFVPFLPNSIWDLDTYYWHYYWHFYWPYL